MGLNLEGVLNKNLGSKLLKEAIETGDIFKDYVPIVVLGDPTPVKYKLSDKGDEELEGTIKLSDTDFDKLFGSLGKPADLYNFILETGGELIDIKISGKQIFDENFKGNVLVKNRAYDILMDTEGDISGDDVGDNSEVGSTHINLKDKEFDKFNGDFDTLKSSASKLKSLKLSKYADNPNFRKSLVLNLVNSKLSNIKVNGEPISVTLKKLYDNKLLEAPPKRRDVNKKQQLPQGWENQVSDFYVNLFRVFATLSKCCSDSETHTKIKEFFKNLYIITREGKANYSDEKKRDQLFKRVVGNMGNIINYLVGGIDFTNKKSQVENIIREVEEKKQIIFTDFDINPEDIEDSFENFADEYDIDNDDSDNQDQKWGDGKYDPKDIERAGFNLYGKDAGKLFPKLSFKFKDIKTLFGLLGRGDMSGRQEKMKDKYGIYDLSYAQSDPQKAEKMSNLPKVLLQFINEVNYKKDDAFVKFKPEDKVMFNYSKKGNVLIHKTSQKKHTNASQILIEMKKEPRVGDTYESKIIKMIPLKGETFSIEPNYKVMFKVIQEGEDKDKDSDNEKK